MAQCSFEQPYSGNITEIIAKARKAIQEAGGTMTGDDQQGIFQVATPVGPVSGGYQVSAGIIHMQITDKPFFVSCRMIEDRLRESFGTLA